MIDTIYLEDAAREHPRTTRVLGRFPEARVVPCERWGNVFNPAGQDFRLQKARPALILGYKHDNHVLEAPAGYGIGGRRNYYFSHMLNCVYDCRYCFLQGMFRSAHHVLFVNYEDFLDAIDERTEEGSWFFSGYDCDSLALESITGFVAEFLPWFARRPAAGFELRTKSIAVQPLLEHEPLANVVVAFSFTPAPVARALEHGTPDVGTRIDVLRRLAVRGWPIGIRLDPLIHYEGWRDGYDELLRSIFVAVPEGAVHSVSVGPLRFPKEVFARIRSLYPEDPLLAGPLQHRQGAVSYTAARESRLLDFIRRRLGDHVPASKTFVCSPAGA